MSLLRRERLELKLGDYSVGTATALVDPKHLTAAQDYKRQIASRMIPLEANDLAKRFSVGDYHVSLKIDGEFSLFVYEDGEYFTINPGGTIRVGLAFQKEMADRLKAAGIRKACFVGELYFVRPDGKRPRVHDVNRVARQPNSRADLDGLRFGPFDFISIDGVAPTPSFHETWKKLTELFGDGTLVKPPESHWVKDGKELDHYFHHWVDAGAEGAVVRSDSAGLFKVKPRHTLDAVVIGFTESVEEDRHGMIHDLLVALMRSDGCLHVLGHVGGGFTEEERRGFTADLKDRIVGSDYVEVNDQVAYHMVRPEVVIEISVLDLLVQNTRGMPINKMALNWNAPLNRYQIVRRLPLVGMISPQFVRRREEKRADATDIRLKQVTDLVDVPLADRDARQLNMRPSTVLRREVYTKVLKGQTMVRKFLMWETNKQEEMDDFPAFVIHFADFSPNRKVPLEREIRISNSREQIHQLWRELLADNIAKGWVIEGDISTAVTQDKPEPKLPTVSEAEEATSEKPAPKKRGKAKATEVSEPAASEDPPSEPTVAKPATRKRASPKKKDEEG